jgi:hypothetical protein
VLDRKKLAAFSAAAGRFLRFPIGDRRCKRTRASVGNAGGNARPSLTNATLAASRKDVIKNVVTTAGKNQILDLYLTGATGSSSPGPHMGLIGWNNYSSAPQATDTMSSHGGWQEAGGTYYPTYNESTRRAMGWNAASGGSKSMSSALAFTITSTGTCKGCFLVMNGSGWTTAKDNGSGTLISAGLFTGGDKQVGSGDTINVSWSLGLT